MALRQTFDLPTSEGLMARMVSLSQEANVESEDLTVVGIGVGNWPSKVQGNRGWPHRRNR